MNRIHKRGFASLTKARRKELAAMGGKASGGNFKNDPERAIEAGRLGGKKSRRKK